jgi:micrococcal nuclease
LKSLLKISIAIILSLFLANCSENKRLEKKSIDFPLTFEGKVIAIKDGDTYVVLYNNFEYIIRLAHIDCPEKRQPFGSRAKQFASDICFGKTVIVQTEGKTDRYRRIIGEIILQDGTNVNKELVRNGFAWHFKKYSEYVEYAELETMARQKQVGLWADKYPTAPWEWRHK